MMSRFSPVSGILGGSLIGGSAAVLLLTNGDIMGISGILNNSLGKLNLKDSQYHWRWVYLAGFSTTVHLYVVYLAASPEAALADDRSADADVPIPSFLAHILGGLLVGMGTRIGNGCTTGHGICGIGRLSLRSLVATLTFTGMSICTTYFISPLRSWSGLLTSFLRQSEAPTRSPLASYLVVAGSCAAAALSPNNNTNTDADADASEDLQKKLGAYLSGAMFAAGLAFSGMTKNSKVHDFLCFSGMTRNSYDPTLMTVMGSGILTSWLAYQLLPNSSQLLTKKDCLIIEPICVKGGKFGVPTNTAIDAKLLTGASLFGIGWGLTGICPGPAIYAASAGLVDATVAWLPAFLAGSYLGERASEKYFAAAEVAAAPAAAAAKEKVAVAVGGTSTETETSPPVKVPSSSTTTTTTRLQIATWNIAAINNNPFEYWITYKEDPNYETLMVDIEHFLENPGDLDVPVTKVFTPAMFYKLDERLKAIGWKSVRSYWEDDFSRRKIIEQFMKDPTLGSKRLASMPDRFTNTVGLADGSQAFRPTVINMYDGDLSNQEKWWTAWEKFMFEDALPIKSKTGEVEQKIPYSLLKPISKAKYPAITEQEEADSLPLQTLCAAIFDAVLVYMMNTISKTVDWQSMKHIMVENLNKQKIPHTLDILERQYNDSDVLTLQEVSSAFLDRAKAGPLGELYHICAPYDLDVVRDQNSVILLKKTTFPNGMIRELTSDVKAAFPEGETVPVSSGDILALTTQNEQGLPFVVASFHGDTNGLATKPVLKALIAAMQEDSELSKHQLIFGLDANTYEHAKPGKQQDVLDFCQEHAVNGLASCWGDTTQDPSKYYTTYNARTYLQPQLNKACRQEEKRSKGDVNPKDFILFPNTGTIVKTWKDNTGERSYVEDMAFPTLQFPSDHGVVATIVELSAGTSWLPASPLDSSTTSGEFELVKREDEMNVNA